MPTRDEHLSIAQRAEAAALTNEGPHPEWAMVMLFYAALHYVEAYWDVMYAVLGCKQHYENHRERREPIERHLAPIWKHYRALERRAHDARYKGETFSQQEVREARSQRLNPLKQHILQELKPPTRNRIQ